MEGFAYLGMGICCLITWLLTASLLTLILGATSFVYRLQRPGQTRAVLLSAAVAAWGGLIFFLLVGGIGFIVFSAQQYYVMTFQDAKLSDAVMQPFLSAMNEVDRVSLGFSPIPPDARIKIERPREGRLPYDVMLHIYADTSRTVAFRKEDDSYRWIAEQEVHTGPHKYSSVDGYLDEQIIITYHKESLDATSLNKTVIIYLGDDPRLKRKAELTLQDVQPVLDEWRLMRSKTPTPTKTP
ncbi:MAG: hypothetical protein FJ015_07435 [Chloroflexi bacterium]|nr:hypothetical protein [Chloroflexota bacterium]